MKRWMIAAMSAVLLTACSAPKPVAIDLSVVSQEPEPLSGRAESEHEAGSEVGGTESESVIESGGAETAEAGNEAIKQVLDQIDLKLKVSSLTDVQALLDSRQIFYEGTYNRSRERLDMVLEDGSRLMFLAVTDDMDNPKGMELMMINDQFNGNGFQENYLNHYDVTIDEEYFPETKEKILDQDRKWYWNQTDMSIARNEIFARHGRIFSDPFLDAVFRSKSWYKPQYTAEEFAKKEAEALNSFEKSNLKLLIEMERDRGFRLEEGADYDRPNSLLSGSWLDLDGDGKKERVTYHIEEEQPYATQTYVLAVDGKSVKGQGENLHGSVWIASLDGKTIQLLAAQDGPSADPMADVYTYKNGTLNAAGLISGDSLQILKDRFYAFAQCDHFQTFQGKLQYEFKNGKVNQVDRDFYEQSGEATALMEVPLLARKGGEPGITIKSGETVVIVGGDNKEWICLEKKGSGEKGWLRCVAPYDCILPDGRELSSTELFEGPRI